MTSTTAAPTATEPLQPALRAVTLAERPDLKADLLAADHDAYPAFLMHSAFADVWPSVYDEFPDYQFALLDDCSGAVLAHGNSVPFHWDGNVASLPDSATALAERARSARRAGTAPTALGALQAVVHVEHQGQGLSRRVLETMAGLADQRDLADLFAPIRPTHKERYPLTDMAAYARWRRDDGSPQDPWMRVHHDLGAVLVGVPQAWATVTGSRAQWEDWTGMSLPQTGTYVVPGGLVPVRIDVEADHGRYDEPHIWMHYRIRATDQRV
jgi:GNAT superfamily N-acetyltransferase